MKMKKIFLLTIIPVIFICLSSSLSKSEELSTPFEPVVVQSIKSDTSPELRSITPVSSEVSGTIQEIPLMPLPGRIQNQDAIKGQDIDPVVQDWLGAENMPAPIRNFEGVNNVNGVLPPDTNGDVGPNHYVQMVNISFAIWDKSGNLLYGPVNNNTLWSGFGGICESNNNGDPIVLYDSLADRWLMSQFALGSTYHQCIAISQTPDPLGAWHRYDFLISTTKMNDYPKFGVWPDGYYMSINQFLGGTTWAGAGVVAFERSKMLAGLPARMVYFDLYSVNPDFGGMLPSDLDGLRPPPAASPNYFVEVDDNAWGWATDRLQIFKFHVDWNNPAASTFTGPTVLNTASFDANMCNYSRNCIPQPGTTRKVDAISDRLMYRLQYRNFRTHETLVMNHTVDVDGSDHAGIRWYEVRDPGGAPYIYQQGTFAPDAHNRWMGSIAMDGNGNIALGYSASSSSLYPSIGYVGRLSGDPLGTLPQGETALILGSGSQTHSASRWGDYSSMSVDPTDDCTYWYTQEYYVTTSSAGWQTRIGSFKFPSCATTKPGPDIKANGSDGPVTIKAGDNLSVDLQLSPGDFSGDNADWWVLASSPFGWYHYDLNAGWVPGQVVTYQGALFNLTPLEVLNMTGLPTGAYTFYFGVDMNMEGSVDMGVLLYDGVVVNITP